MKSYALLVIGLLGLSVHAQANSLSVALSGDAARFEFQTTHMALGLGNANSTYSVAYNDDNDWILGGHVEVFGQAAPAGQGSHGGAGVGPTRQDGQQMQPGLHGGAGVGLLFGDARDNDVLAIGLSGNLRYVLPQANRFAVSGQVLLAPDITSFMDSEGYVDWGVQGEYELTREARLFIGYRDIEVDVETGPDVDFESGLYAGVSIRF